jgi:hypothetical protein
VDFDMVAAMYAEAGRFERLVHLLFVPGPSFAVTV